MREFAKISSEFWTSITGKKIKNCNSDAKVIALYLMTNRHVNMIGFYYLPILFITHEAGISFEGTSKELKSLIEIGFCSYDYKHEYVWVHDVAAQELGQLKKNDNRIKYVNTICKKLINIPLLNNFYEKYKDLLKLDVSFEAPLKAPRSQDKEQKQDKEKEQKQDKEIKNIPNLILGGEQTTSDVDEEEISVKNVITFPVKTKSSAVFTVPLRQGGPRIIEQSEVDEWQKNYPDIDVRQELRQLIAWNQVNPDRQKTKRGINRHIQGWLAHAKKPNYPAQPLSTWDHNMGVINQLLEEDHGG